MKTMNGIEYKKALISGSNQLWNNKARIDSMNVFPVPDGDTGTNMSSSTQYAVEELKSNKSESVADISSKFSRAILLGARGNSGVILSQMFKGLSIGFKDKKEINQFDIVNAFREAKEYAYNSVIKPVEGTMLTVIRMVSDTLSETVTANFDINQVFDLAAKRAKEASLETPEYLPVLKEVGVTDSGGEGILMFLEGMASAIQGKPVNITDEVASTLKQSFLNSEEDNNGEFGYCTEFIVDLNSAKSFKRDKFEIALQKMGDSIVAVADDEILKIHIHTKRPGTVLNFAHKFGEFLKIKVENMTVQANETHKAKVAAVTAKTGEYDLKNMKEVPIGVISCNTGEGIIHNMQDLGASFIINAGQSANPSAKNFVEAIKQIKADKIFILPNNPNIILAAQQAAQTTDKNVIVIPTKTQMEGIVAMMNFDPNTDFESIREIMQESLDDVKTGEITKAARTTKVNGINIKEGEYMGIAERKIVSSDKSKFKAVIAVVDKLANEDTELITIYYGEEEGEIDAEEIGSYIESNTNADVEIKNGSQPLYNFLIAFE